MTRETQTMMGDLTYEIAFDDARVPAENLIGNEGDGMSRAQTWITAGRLYQACRGLGVAQRCIALMGKYAKERVTFGAPLAERQAVQFMLADSVTEHAMTQLLVYQAVGRNSRRRIAPSDLRWRNALRLLRPTNGGYSSTPHCQKS